MAPFRLGSYLLKFRLARKSQGRSWVSIRSSYENFRKRRLREIFRLGSIGKSSSDRLDDWKEAFIFYEEDLHDLRTKLTTSRKKGFRYFHKLSTLQLPANNTYIWFAEAAGVGLVLVKKDKSFNLKFIESDRLKQIHSAAAALGDRNYDSTKRRSVLKEISDVLFDGIHLELKNNVFLSGPLAFGTPIGLLKNKNGRFIIEYDNPEVYFSTADYVRAVSTASNFSQLFSLRSTSPRRFLGIGNPILESPEQIAKAGVAESLIRGGNSDLTKLPELPETEVELKEFAGYSNNSYKLLVRDDATKKKIFDINFGDYEVASFATHGLTSGELPGILYPSLVLSASKDYDELLSVRDISLLSGMSKVVVLSACNTSTKDQGLNKTGINSLATAFYVKGARSIISSYWQVNSLATKELMSSFAKNYFSEGRPVVASFWDSVRRVKQTSDDPIDWGAFVPIGNFQTSAPKVAPENEISTLFAYDVVPDVDHFYALSVSEDVGPKRTILTKAASKKGSTQIEITKFADLPNPMQTARISITKDTIEIVGTNLDRKRLDVYSIRKADQQRSLLCSKYFETEVYVVQTHSTSEHLFVLLEGSADTRLLKFDRSTCRMDEYISPHSHNFLPTRTGFFISNKRPSVIVLIRSYDKFRDGSPKSFGGRLSTINTEIKCQFHSWSEIQLVDLSSSPILSFDVRATSFRLPSSGRQNANSRYVHFIEEMPCRFSRTAIFSLDLDKLINSSSDTWSAEFKSHDDFYKERKGQQLGLSGINNKYSFQFAIQEASNGKFLLLGAPAAGHFGIGLISDDLRYFSRGWEALADGGLFLVDERDKKISPMIGCAPKDIATAKDLVAMTCNVYGADQPTQKIKFFHASQ